MFLFRLRAGQLQFWAGSAFTGPFCVLNTLIPTGTFGHQQCHEQTQVLPLQMQDATHTSACGIENAASSKAVHVF